MNNDWVFLGIRWKQVCLTFVFLYFMFVPVRELDKELQPLYVIATIINIIIFSKMEKNVEYTTKIRGFWVNSNPVTFLEYVTIVVLNGISFYGMLCFNTLLMYVVCKSMEKNKTQSKRPIVIGDSSIVDAMYDTGYYLARDSEGIYRYYTNEPLAMLADEYAKEKRAENEKNDKNYYEKSLEKRNPAAYKDSLKHNTIKTAYLDVTETDFGKWNDTLLELDVLSSNNNELADDDTNDLHDLHEEDDDDLYVMPSFDKVLSDDEEEEDESYTNSNHTMSSTTDNTFNIAPLDTGEKMLISYGAMSMLLDWIFGKEEKRIEKQVEKNNAFYHDLHSNIKYAAKDREYNRKEAEQQAKWDKEKRERDRDIQRQRNEESNRQSMERIKETQRRLEENIKRQDEDRNRRQQESDKRREEYNRRNNK